MGKTGKNAPGLIKKPDAFMGGLVRFRARRQMP